MTQHQQRTSLQSPYVFCLGAVIVAACLRLWLFNGLYGHDDWVYLFYTRSHLNGDNHELVNVISGLRWGVWLPVATLFKLFGVHYWLTFLPGFLAGLACIPIAYLIGLKISDSHHVARWAAAALIVNPVDWFVSTTFRGDIEISFFSGIILLGLVYLETKPQKTSSPALLPFAIGLVWGLATLTKEWAFIFGWAFFVVVLFKLIRERRIAWHYLYILLGLGLILVIDGFILYQITGNAFQRFERSLMLYDILRAEGAFVNDLSLSYRYLPSIMLNIDSPYRDHQRFVNGYPYYGYYFYLGLLGLGYALWTFRRAKAASWLVAGFLLGLLLWMQFGSMSLKVYTPYHKEPRYLTIISVATAVLLGFALSNSWSALTRFGQSLLATVLSALCIHTAVLLHSEHKIYIAHRDFIPELEKWLQQNKHVRLWLGATLQQELDLKSGYSFSDTVQRHAGKEGYGSLLDIAFLEQALPGDYLLYSIGSAGALENRINPERWDQVGTFQSIPETARLYRLKALPQSDK